MKINYVIATWSGTNSKRNLYYKNWGNPRPNDVLKIHLQQINKYHHNLSQITIMKPFCSIHAQLDGYYNIDDEINAITKKVNAGTASGTSNTLVKIIECENYGYSSGQWLLTYEKTKFDFDYYIFSEDDYCPFADNFDSLLVQQYNKTFTNNIGHLSGFVEGYPKHPSHIYPEHWSGIVVLSSETLGKLYNSKIWKGTPRLYLNNNLINDNDYLKLKKMYLGAFNQINFALLFTLLKIPLNDYCKDYPVPYFSEERNQMYYMLHNCTSSESLDKSPVNSNSDIQHNAKHLIVPIQFIYY